MSRNISLFQWEIFEFLDFQIVAAAAVVVVVVVVSHESKVTKLWNQQVQTDRTIPNNKPDVIIRNNKEGTCMLIDAAIPGNRCVFKKEAEKILKYKDLIMEVQRMWNVKAQVILVTGTISKSLRQYLSNIPRNHKIKELQKNGHIGHCTYTAGSANVTVQNMFHGRNNTTCSTNCQYKTAATSHTLET